MPSHAQDKTTQQAATQGAQAQDAQLAANAAQNQAFSNQARQSLFGTPNASGQYLGGSLSSYLDPNSANTNSLSGSYLNNYNNSANQVNQGAKNSVGTTMQDLANRGMGKSPAGFAADQERKAYQDAATQNGNLYSSNLQGQHNEAMNNFWNASNMLNSNATNTANLSLQGNQAAANNYSNLYGTASQQVQSGWGTALGAVAGLGQAAGSVMTGIGGSKGVCWVAAELFGGWDDPRVSLVREWIFGPFAETAIGSILSRAYLRFGERVAKMIRTNRPLRFVMQKLFNAALRKAEAR